MTRGGLGDPAAARDLELGDAGRRGPHDGSVETGPSLPHRPELDGLRGIAVLLVLAYHATNWLLLDHGRFAGLGSAGVAMFFTLSGYLITNLFDSDHRLGRFYRNRAVRLLPALGFAILAFWALQTWLRFELMPGIAWVIAYAANWGEISGHDLGVFDPTWSLAVEEQFYLVWPLVLLCTWRNPRVQPWTTAGLLAVTTLARCHSVSVHG